MAFFDFLFGEDKPETQTVTQEPKFYQAPEYSETEGARKSWWNSLQDWGNSGNYGVNLPNYDKVYENAQNRINQYYWGGPSGGGLINKMRAGAARRGMSDSPAADVLAQRMGVEQANQLGDISTNLDVTKANAVETARNNWLNSIMSLSNLRPQGTWGATTTTTVDQPQEGALPYLIGGGIQLLGNQMNNQFLEKMINQSKNRTDITTPSTITGQPNDVDKYFTGYEKPNFLSTIMDLATAFI